MRLYASARMTNRSKGVDLVPKQEYNNGIGESGSVKKEKECCRMGRKIILCAISTISPRAEEKDYTYQTADGRIIQCRGLQTNEAPVKCLLDCYRPVEKVLCMVSEQARKERRSEPCLGVRAYDFFVAGVTRFCQEGRKHPLRVPEFVPIDYQTDRASLSMGQLLEQLQTGDEVYMDVTGGGRDAMFLLMMAMQLLQYKSIKLEAAVYSDLNAQKVRSWQVETDLFALIKAVEDFTSYGKADKLCSYFHVDDSAQQQGVRLNKAVRRLCTNAKVFSDRLALCRTDELDETVEKVHDAMRKARSEVKDQPGLQLFLALIPQMQAGFVPESDDPSERMLNLIEWCNNHELWLQALALYRENVPKCLFDMGILRRSDTLRAYAEKNMQIKAAPETRDWCSGVVLKLCDQKTLLELHPTFAGAELRTAVDILDDWDALRIIRNECIHNNETGNQKHDRYQQLKNDLKTGGPRYVKERLETALKRLRAAAAGAAR